MAVVRVGMAEAHDRCWVTVEGELDRDTSEALRAHVVALGERGCRRVLIDLRATTFIDSSGLSVLVAAMEEIAELGGELVLRAPPADVYDQGRVRRLGELLAIVDDAIDEAEAINRLSALFAPEDLEAPEPDYQTWTADEAAPAELADGARLRSADPLRQAPVASLRNAAGSEALHRPDSAPSAGDSVSHRTEPRSTRRT